MNVANLVRVEIRRALCRPLIRWMIAFAVAGCLAVGVIAYLSSGDPLQFAGDPDHPARMVNWWRGGADGLLTVAAFFLLMGAAICGASYAGAEWKAGTVTTVLTWEPSRRRLHAARTIAAALLAFVVAIALQLVMMLAVLPAVLLNGTTTGTTGAWWASLAMAVVRIALVAAMIAVLAVNVATIGRNTAAALIAVAGWALVLERVVVGLRPKWARFMIIENAATVVPWRPMSAHGFVRPPAVALAALLAYLAVVVGLATLSFTRRDIGTVT